MHFLLTCLGIYAAIGLAIAVGATIAWGKPAAPHVTYPVVILLWPLVLFAEWLESK